MLELFERLLQPGVPLGAMDFPVRVSPLADTRVMPFCNADTLISGRSIINLLIVDSAVFDLTDLGKHCARRFVKGRWVLTVNSDKDGKFLKCKADGSSSVFRTSNRWINKLTRPRLPDQDSEWRVSWQQIATGILSMLT